MLKGLFEIVAFQSKQFESILFQTNKTSIKYYLNLLSWTYIDNRIKLYNPIGTNRQNWLIVFFLYLHINTKGLSFYFRKFINIIRITSFNLKKKKGLDLVPDNEAHLKWIRNLALLTYEKNAYGWANCTKHELSMQWAGWDSVF